MHTAYFWPSCSHTVPLLGTAGRRVCIGNASRYARRTQGPAPRIHLSIASGALCSIPEQPVSIVWYACGAVPKLVRAP